MKADGQDPPAERDIERALTGRVVYLMPNHSETDAGLPPAVQKIGGMFWNARWLLVGVATAAAALGYACSYLVTPWYKADVVLVVADGRNGASLLSQFSQVGSLVGLSGLNLGASTSAEPLAVLRSRDFAGQFIRTHQLVESLAPERAGILGRFGQRLSPERREGYAIENFERKIRSIVDDRKAGTITLSIRWSEPKVAAHLANAMAQEINDLVQERTVRESGANVEFLKGEMAATDMVAMQASIGRLLELEMQRLMLARNSDESAFRVVDPARPPIGHYKPNRITVALVCGLVASLAAFFILLYRGRARLWNRHSPADR